MKSTLRKFFAVMLGNEGFSTHLGRRYVSYRRAIKIARRFRKKGRAAWVTPVLIHESKDAPFMR